jgi:hypothetical protein
MFRLLVLMESWWNEFRRVVPMAPNGMDKQQQYGRSGSIVIENLLTDGSILFHMKMTLLINCSKDNIIFSIQTL